MEPETRLGRELADLCCTDDARADLARDPWTALPERFDLEVAVLDTPPSGACGLDGTYDRAHSQVKVAVRSSRRRMHFTLLHELGHHLFRSYRPCIEYAAKLPRDKRGPMEERVANAFAAEILLPSDEVTPLLGDGQVTARKVVQLFEMYPASRSACAQRVSEHCRGNGYVVVAEGDVIWYAAPFGEQMTYPVRRGTVQPPGSPIVEAATRGRWQGRGKLTFRSGRATPTFNVDALVDGDFTFAVFTDGQFPSSQWRLPDVDDEFLDAPEVACDVCDETRPSWARCERCSAITCPECGACPKCKLKKASVASRQCPGCFVTRPASSFPAGSELCTDECQ